MLQEFRKFIMRGNVIDLAVGVIIGAAFGAVVTSLVNDVIMPPIGLIVGGIDFSDIKIILKAAEGEAPEVAINIGIFLNAVINFLIVALAIFFLIRGVNRLQEMAEGKKEEAPAAPPAPTTEELMLAELKAMRSAMEKQK
ncbi:MAG: Large-conductance mechanosensitive channel [Anaerolineae bacterium]|jgi:large conductance mechanosensitive channel|nr:MAG: large-conductance mechanosensitive channel [Chloroflexi bacterium OLB13]MBV6435200.1 Large-conductance mechanosensitive channel [Anaerolineae bacterium]OQY82514.1 MAG: large-conductance mechanosensitive channel [Anaerolineae bacterium UTCFX5]GIK27229.1 MAG: large-conductance mechanosensitive channel [Chloroflexota bacterium]